MNALVLMTRIPVPGKTKTRLMDVMTGEECAFLHIAFLSDLFRTFSELKNELDIFITYSDEGPLSLLDSVMPDCINAFPQEGYDLGEKMYNAIQKILSEGYEKVILIGSDVPDLGSKDIRQAFCGLDDKDIVLGPTYDGGYYLVGMKKPIGEIFHISKKWGGKSVLESTLDIANHKGYRVSLAKKLRDIDVKEDLYEFIRSHKIQEQTGKSSTMRFLKEWSVKNAKRKLDSSN